MAQQVKITREELYRKVWEKPTVKVAAEFGISDVGLGKICRKMDVPKPPNGYWRSIETGAKIKQAPLPKSAGKTKEFVFLYLPAVNGSDKVNQKIQTMIDREELPENHIKIAENLDDAHPLVKEAQQFYDKADIFSQAPLSPPHKAGYLNVSVSPAQARRALFIIDAIIKAVKKHGYETIVSSDYWGEQTRIVKEGEEVSISLYESMRKVQRELSPEEKKKPPYLLNVVAPEYQLNGKLSVKINQRWSSYKKWSDRKNEPLENRLNDIVASIVALLESLVFDKRKKEKEERRRQEIIRRREEEKQRRESFEADAREWRKSENLRDYLNAYEARLVKERGTVIVGSAEADWLKWARRYVANLDPLNKIFSNDE